MALPISPPKFSVPAVALGSSLLWGWSYLFYFASQSKVVIFAADWSDIAHAAASLAAIALTWALVFRKRLSSTEPLADVGCAVLVLGGVVSLFFSTLPNASMLYIAIGKCLTGFGQTLFWIAWLALLARYEVGKAEAAVLTWFIVGAMLMVVVLLCNLAGETEFLVLFTLLQCGVPLASLVCFRIAASRLRCATTDATREAEGSGVPESPKNERLDGFVGIGLFLALAVFSWSVFLNERSYQLQDSSGLFAFSLLLAFVPAWTALRSTRHFSSSTLMRWALPLFAAGVVADHLVGSGSPAIPFLCFSVVSLGLDAFSKLLVIHTARKSEGNRDRRVIIGIGAFTVAAALGSSAWTCSFMFGLPVPASESLLVLLLLACLVYSVWLGEEASHTPTGSLEEKLGQDLNDPAVQHLSLSIGLSARESEVLALLLAGRSRAYIRETLCISKGTVDTHVNHIYKKAGVSSRDELVRLAEQTDSHART